VASTAGDRSIKAMIERDGKFVSKARQGAKETGLLAEGRGRQACMDRPAAGERTGICKTAKWPGSAPARCTSSSGRSRQGHEIARQPAERQL